MSATPARDTLAEATHAAALDMARGSGCCGDEAWRGRMCQFHQGFEDGMDTLLEAVDRTVVLAALVESGGPLTDDELRAAGGRREGLVGYLGTWREWHFPAAPDARGASDGE